MRLDPVPLDQRVTECPSSVSFAVQREFSDDPEPFLHSASQSHCWQHLLLCPGRHHRWVQPNLDSSGTTPVPPPCGDSYLNYRMWKIVVSSKPNFVNIYPIGFCERKKGERERDCGWVSHRWECLTLPLCCAFQSQSVLGMNLITQETNFWEDISSNQFVIEWGRKGSIFPFLSFASSWSKPDSRLNSTSWESDKHTEEDLKASDNFIDCNSLFVIDGRLTFTLSLCKDFAERSGAVRPTDLGGQERRWGHDCRDVRLVWRSRRRSQ